VHRIGRTGRAGRSGAAFTLVSKRDSKYLGAILALTGDSVEWHNGDMSTVVEDASDDTSRGGRGGKDDKRGGRDAKRSSGRGGEKRDRAPKPDHEAQAFSVVENSASIVAEPSVGTFAVVAETVVEALVPQAPREQKPREQRPNNRQPKPFVPREETPQPKQEQREEFRRDDNRRRDNDNATHEIGFGDETPAFMRNGLN
jgi:superfamily II DNA/RNA helicase